MASEIASVISAHLKQPGMVGSVLENHTPASSDVVQDAIIPFVEASPGSNWQETSAWPTSETLFPHDRTTTDNRGLYENFLFWYLWKLFFVYLSVLFLLFFH